MLNQGKLSIDYPVTYKEIVLEVLKSTGNVAEFGTHILIVLGLVFWFLVLYSNNMETILNVTFLFVITYFVEKAFIPRLSVVANLLVIGSILYTIVYITI